MQVLEGKQRLLGTCPWQKRHALNRDLHLDYSMQILRELQAAVAGVAVAVSAVASDLGCTENWERW